MNNFTKLIICLCLITSTCVTKVSAVTRVSACTGNWGNAATWVPSGVPACGDSVVILAAHTVSLNTQQNYSSCGLPLRMMIYGTLKFYNGSKLSLPCGSYIIVAASGVIQADVGMSNSNFIEICSAVVWNSNYVLYGPACMPVTFAVCSTVLPIEMTSFTAKICGRSTCFSWETASEFNSSYFQVEHSLNGLDFSAVKKVNSLAPGGSSSSPIMYSVTNGKPLKGINYYRLVQVDKDSSFFYSRIITLEYTADEPEYNVFPNTNNGEFWIQGSGVKAGQLAVKVQNAAGLVVYNTKHEMKAGDLSLRVNPPSLVPGFYWCVLTVAGERQVAKIVVTD